MRHHAHPSQEAMKIRDTVGFFLAIKARRAKIRGGPGGTMDRDLDTAIKQLVSKSVATGEVMDVFKQAGMDKGVRKIVIIDWTNKEAFRAKIRSVVMRILRNYEYPPDKQEQATQTVLAQAELLCADWAT